MFAYVSMLQNVSSVATSHQRNVLDLAQGQGNFRVRIVRRPQENFAGPPPGVETGRKADQDLAIQCGDPDQSLVACRESERFDDGLIVQEGGPRRGTGENSV